MSREQRTGRRRAEGSGTRSRTPASALGVEPVAAAALPLGFGVQPQATGAASYPATIAQGQPGSTTGAAGLAFDATLRFQPPGSADPGNYRSTLTLTLTSP